MSKYQISGTYTKQTKVAPKVPKVVVPIPAVCTESLKVPVPKFNQGRY